MNILNEGNQLVIYNDIYESNSYDNKNSQKYSLKGIINSYYSELENKVDQSLKAESESEFKNMF